MACIYTLGDIIGDVTGLDNVAGVVVNYVK